ncbi:EAL domain-containing protein [Neisseriaceae bacterium B2N2-7]|uniref:EAL domain-containing protein n=1 Tax=Craterilacuibacter sinensis TaxID=2686017 RepID=A0A845BJ54_9NEIS|nr:EAL domain-containing protein [Craterilacuibacter sinensis]
MAGGGFLLGGCVTFQRAIATLASSNILSCSPETPAAVAARMMVDAHCGSIVVMSPAGKALGIWTESDALKMGVGCHDDLSQAIAGVMSAPVFTLDAGLGTQEVAAFFRQKQIRHALLTRDGEYVGVVSASDIVSHQGSEVFLRCTRLDNLSLAPLVSVGADRPLSEALQVLRDSGRDALAIDFADGSWGILTARDVLALLARQQQDVAVREVCSYPMRSVAVNTSLLAVRQQLLAQKTRHMGVSGLDGCLQAIVGMVDIMYSIEHEFIAELQQALQQRDAALANSRQNLMLAEKVFESTQEGIVVTDPAGVILHVNAAFTRITGYSREEVLGNTPAILQSGQQSPEFYQSFWQSLKNEGNWQGELVNRRKNGVLYSEHLSISGIREPDGSILHYVGVFSDITQRKLSEERLHYLANHDALTGLFNRTLFADYVADAVQRSLNGGQFAVLHVNLDRFKLINDTLGHQVGDALLRQVATTLKSSLPDSARVARLAGDEFGVLYEYGESVVLLAALVQKTLDQLAGEIQVDGNPLFITASIGVALYPDDGHNAETLLLNADAAMHKAKARGKNAFQFYASDMNVRAMARLELEFALHRVLEREELALYYQPKIDLASGRCCGAEALLRWFSPDLGSVSPAAFIPLAEETGLIIPIGEWVLRTACTQASHWLAQGVLEGRVAVNLSGRQFASGNIVAMVRRILDETGLPAGFLELEITESTAMDVDSDVLGQLSSLRALGIALSIDDFGTGYSSLAYLKKLPVSVLKVDQSFIKDLHHDRDDAAIAAAIISMARSLELDIVAEGVELEAHRQFLLQHGCTMAQGYLFSRPLPAQEMGRWLAGDKAACIV